MDISSILAAIAADAERGDIVFPTHTDIALRVQRMLEDPDCAIDALGKLIAAEPILAARVIGLANSVSYNPGAAPSPNSRTRSPGWAFPPCAPSPQPSSYAR